ncbi:MAG: restriction endonuclease [Stackebrandtia sp.]
MLTVLRSASLSTKIVAGLSGLILGYLFIRTLAGWINANFVAVAIGVGVLAATAVGSLGFRHFYVTQRQRRDEDSPERHLAECDEMDIPQFESWVAQLLLRDGFRKVRFIGRSGDFGSNFLATAPDASRVVVRAKPDDGTLGRRGARHIQALGADARGKWQTDTAILVTNADMHPVRTAARHDALAAQLGVVLVDRFELAVWVAERELPALPAAPVHVG